MNLNDFELISRTLKERSGLVLTKDKAYLLESRLNPVARKWQFKGFDELAKAIRLGGNEDLLRDVTEAMTTNESFFFRDRRPFDQFRDFVLPRFLESRAGTRSIRIWSAACSSGQEPYSLAIVLKEQAAKLAGWKIDIVATDLSTEILDRAREGNYSQFEVQRGLPIDLLVKYFVQDGERWRISDDIRKMVTFKKINLLENLAGMGRFDLVFCRNVLIYFDQPTKTEVLKNIAGLMPDDGFLFLGGAETVLGISDRFAVVDGQRGVYAVESGTAAMPASATG